MNNRKFFDKLDNIVKSLLDGSDRYDDIFEDVKDCRYFLFSLDDDIIYDHRNYLKLLIIIKEKSLTLDPRLFRDFFVTEYDVCALITELNTLEMLIHINILLTCFTRQMNNSHSQTLNGENGMTIGDLIRLFLSIDVELEYTHTSVLDTCTIFPEIVIGPNFGIFNQEVKVAVDSFECDIFKPLNKFVI
nr:p22 protein [Cucurbit chlorotic yellows virus]